MNCMSVLLFTVNYSDKDSHLGIICQVIHLNDLSVKVKRYAAVPAKIHTYRTAGYVLYAAILLFKEAEHNQKQQ